MNLSGDDESDDGDNNEAKELIIEMDKNQDSTHLLSHLEAKAIKLNCHLKRAHSANRHGPYWHAVTKMKRINI